MTPAVISFKKKTDEKEGQFLLWRTGGMRSRYYYPIDKVVYLVDDNQIRTLQDHNYKIIFHEESVYYE